MHQRRSWRTGLGMVQKQVAPQEWPGRRPEGDAPRSEASAWGLARRGELDPSHPALVTCKMLKLNHAPVSSREDRIGQAEVGGGPVMGGRQTANPGDGPGVASRLPVG